MTAASIRATSVPRWPASREGCSSICCGRRPNGSSHRACITCVTAAAGANCSISSTRRSSRPRARSSGMRWSASRTARSAPSPSIASPCQWRYRRKLTLALRQDGHGRWIAGLHRIHSPDSIFPLDDCPITEERVVDVWRAVMRAADLLPDAAAFRVAVRISDPQRQGSNGSTRPGAGRSGRDTRVQAVRATRTAAGARIA